MKDLILIFILLIFLYFLKNNNEKMTNNKNFNYLNSTSSIFVKNKVYATDDKIEITKLPKCTKNINVDYIENTNSIVNNNISIYQNMNDLLQNTIEIDNTNFNLISIRWKISKFKYNNNNVGLDLQLVHQNFKSVDKVIIVIPLDFIQTELKSIENFKNIGYNTSSKIFKNYDFNVINNLKNINYSGEEESIINDNLIRSNNNYDFNLKINYDNKKIYTKKILLDTLLQSDSIIPKYNGDVDTIGQIAKFNLCSLQQLILKNTEYYQLEDHHNDIYYISEPIGIPANLGFGIRNKISMDNDIVYLKT
jgi:hypothetical protein